jgi:hypothetical protein
LTFSQICYIISSSNTLFNDISKPPRNWRVEGARKMKLTPWLANLIWHALLLLLVGGCNSGQVVLPTATGVAGPTSTSLPTSQSPTSDGGSNPEVAIEATAEYKPLPTPRPHGLPETRLNAGDYQPHDMFGYAVDVDGALLAAGAPGKNGAGLEAGGEYFFEPGTNIISLRSLMAGQEVGGVYIFERSGQEWNQMAALVPDSLRKNDRLGTSVAVEGGTVAAGAPYATTQAGGFAAGAVYVFARQGDGWVEQARLTAGDGGPFDLFGSALALDGDTLVVGAQGVDDPALGRNAGAAYVYHREKGAWVEQARLSPPDGGADDFFGQSVAIHGEVIAVGAYGHDDPESGPNSGAVYLFQGQDGAWYFNSKLASAEPSPKAQFGFSLAFAGELVEPTWLAVGANQYASQPVDIRYAAPPGRVDLFRWQDQAWQPATRLDIEQDEEMQTGLVGATLAMDLLGGERLALAAGSQFGTSVHLFQGSDRTWGPATIIQPEEYQLTFGKAVAISDRFLAVSSPWSAERLPDGQSVTEVPQSGAVFIYDLSGLK